MTKEQIIRVKQSFIKNIKHIEPLIFKKRIVFKYSVNGYLYDAVSFRKFFTNNIQDYTTKAITILRQQIAKIELEIIREQIEVEG